MIKPAIRAVALLSAILTARAASACSCRRPDPPRQALDRAAAVFAGRVVAMTEENPRRDGMMSSMDPFRIEFAVSRSWKGPRRKALAARTVRDGASCGYRFEPGKEYLVFAYTDGGELWVGLCSRTKPLADAKEDLAALGRGKPPRR
ncbi:MAG: hypothetical protein HY553_22570 [Elusimicrobia bacterium]|nr:hypothetical protein [Elusimicrobiota bacterium]